MEMEMEMIFDWFIKRGLKWCLFCDGCPGEWIIVKLGTRVV